MTKKAATLVDRGPQLRGAMPAGVQLRRNNLDAMLRATTLVRASSDTAKREFDGVGVPYNTVIDLGWGDFEAFDPGSIELHEQGTPVLWQHRTDEPIGLVIATEDTPEAFKITGRLSEVARALEAYVLLQDGVVCRLSIGFQPSEYRVDEEGVIHWTKVVAREFSLVTFPAYDDAAITAIRAAARPPISAPMAPSTNPKGNPMDPETLALIEQMRAEQAETKRAMDVLRAGHAPAAQLPLFRSFGEYVKATAAGNDEARQLLEAVTRAWTGGVLADNVDLPTWLGMIRHDMAAKQPITNLFGRSYDLPAQGNTLEYGFLASDTTQVDEQAAEGDALLFGKVTFDTDAAQVKTYGGWSPMSKQAIDRAPVAVLDTLWAALARRYARTIETKTRALVNATITAREATPTITVTKDLTALTYKDWVALLVDLISASEDSDWALDGLLLSPTVFKSVAILDKAETAMTVNGSNGAAGEAGTLTIPTASGEMLKVPFVSNRGQAGDHVSTFATSAVQVKESAGAPLQLTDGDVTNLTNAYSVYGYAAHYVTGDGAFMTVKKAA